MVRASGRSRKVSLRSVGIAGALVIVTSAIGLVSYSVAQPDQNTGTGSIENAANVGAGSRQNAAAGAPAQKVGNARANASAGAVRPGVVAPPPPQPPVKLPAAATPGATYPSVGSVPKKLPPKPTLAPTVPSTPPEVKLPGGVPVYQDAPLDVASLRAANASPTSASTTTSMTTSADTATTTTSSPAAASS